MDQSVQNYEQKIEEQKNLLDEALAKLEKREFQLYEQNRGRFNGKKGGSQRINPQNFDTLQPLSPPSTEKNIAGIAKKDITVVCQSLQDLVHQRRSK